ncbi:putative manganese-transporting ATPase PDR2 [Zea mays]|uniref:Putative manganese-transporting ATPase PDR2 n=1 Tax=Zea mays TaxID=4577 RepID=A0A3L6FPE9_MAIZE|nr:putative manganese-transporting ATPase PDR2 [Zea mays]
MPLLLWAAVPALQHRVSIAGRGPDDMLSIRRDKNHILFGGTKVLRHTADKVTANNKESGLFILFLLFVAIIASGYVLVKGLDDPTRSRYKLLLSFSLIITSVIPPELLMELSIAVNTSLIALARHGIFWHRAIHNTICWEDYFLRALFDQVDICCFDKIGTLTSDDMEFQGIVTSEGDDLISDANKLPLRTQEVLSSCHALVFVDNKLEIISHVVISYYCAKGHLAELVRWPGGQPVQIVHRYHFASHLKRMSVIVCIQQKFYAFIKGALETIQEKLVDLPAAYVETYKKYTRQGSRVLSLAYKLLPEMPVSFC